MTDRYTLGLINLTLKLQIVTLQGKQYGTAGGQYGLPSAGLREIT